MSQFKGIPILSAGGEPARSGEKYRTPQGFTAIKDGIKAAAKPAPAGTREIGARNPGARKPGARLPGARLPGTRTRMASHEFSELF